MPPRRQAIAADGAPAAIGPYSQAIVAGGFVFCSGQIPLDPATGELVTGDVAAQTRRVLDNVRAVLESAGTSLDAVAKTTVFLADMSDFAAMNAVYAEYFSAPAPARSTVQAAALPRAARVEIEVVALLPAGGPAPPASLDA
jgi:2-iminobutanoate/2-iminopropanoate deaminase